MSAHWLYWTCKLCLPGQGQRVSPGWCVLAEIHQHLAGHDRRKRVMWP